MRRLVTRIGVTLAVLAGFVLVDVTPAAANDYVYYGNTIWLRNEEVRSPDGETGLWFTPGGYFVVWQGDYDHIVWGSTGGTGTRGIFQTDGNLVVYTSDNRPVWSSESNYLNCLTSGRCTLHIQDDGNVVIYDGVGFPIWFTGTWHRSTSTKVVDPLTKQRLLGGTNVPAPKVIH
jgi:hypothetical protein